MDGMLGKRALGLLQAVIGRREADRSPTRPDPGLDVVEQAVERAMVGGATPSATVSADGASETDRLEATRRELDAALSRIFSSAADAIFTIDAQQRIMM